MHDYDATELMELVDDHQTKNVEIGYSEGSNITGVVMPFDITAGQFMDTRFAKKLAAQILRQADIHDAIFENGWRTCVDANEPYLRHMKKTLQEVYEWMTKGEGNGPLRYSEVLDHVARALGLDLGIPDGALAVEPDEQKEDHNGHDEDTE